MSLTMSNKEKYAIAVVLFCAAIAFFIVEQYFFCVILIVLLLVLLKLNELVGLAFGKDGLQLKFAPPIEKIEEDLRQNNLPVNNENIENYKQIEEAILTGLAHRYGSALKRQIHFVYGEPARPDFRYTPDGSLQTDDALYFFEIKHVNDNKLLQTIVDGSISQLKMVYDKLAPSAGARLVIKLIIATHLSDLNIDNIQVPEGIELEIYNI